jgi:hypothetical protein
MRAGTSPCSTEQDWRSEVASAIRWSKRSRPAASPISARVEEVMSHRDLDSGSLRLRDRIVRFQESA